MDTRTCKFCGVEFHKHHVGQLTGDIDGTFNDGYCSKFHRKDHEKQMIREGIMERPEIGHLVFKDKQYKDASGESVYFKEPYFDQGLRRQFNSVQEKAGFLNKYKYVDSGQSTLSSSKFKSELEKAKYYARKDVQNGK